MVVSLSGASGEAVMSHVERAASFEQENVIPQNPFVVAEIVQLLDHYMKQGSLKQQ